jgi:hypothetical protein
MTRLTSILLGSKTSHHPTPPDLRATCNFSLPTLVEFRSKQGGMTFRDEAADFVRAGEFAGEGGLRRFLDYHARTMVLRKESLHEIVVAPPAGALPARLLKKED